ncbi:hypothetical protein HXX76_011465 [Chlamydomonas incerta]|uniref:KIF-binding protein n=1 Tax=Chlamydomonas incerta TaxID=51695 RepID=A0A835SV06_CHLIN|nr:hypothetical protein HXX76_011465 [Chlamydomonas incerta]|eukprot:KAG2428764.1 hypothetical protein HXX76_011465 [Chlamydomonas incerta]
MNTVQTVPEFLEAIKRATAISAREESEEEPYKFHYEAADVLRSALGEPPLLATSNLPGAEAPPTSAPAPAAAESTASDSINAAAKPDGDASSAPTAVDAPSVPAAPSSSGRPSPQALAAAAARIRCGLILLDTDLLPDGEAYVKAGLGTLEAAPGAAEAYLAWLLEAYNALGALYSNRGSHAIALEWLQKAESLYQRVTATGTRHAHLNLPIAGAPKQQQQQQQQEPVTTPLAADKQEQQGAAGDAAAAGVAADGAAAEPGAAAAAAAVPPPELAVAADGGGQAELVELPGCDSDRVQDQYTSTLYFMAQVYANQKLQDRSALYCAATMYRQLAAGKYDLDTWVNNCLQLGGYYAKVNAFGLALYCHAAAQAVVDRDTAAGAELGEDIAANIKLATARVYNLRLAASHAHTVESKHQEFHYPDVSHFPDYLRFPGLAVPSPDSFPWGAAALATTFDAARELLNTGMPYFKEALAYYQLDGWVTDHVGIIMDMSNMYRCLAGFEADPGRAAAMQRCRAQLLEPLSGGLNPEHYPGLSRSIDLELAHVYREISDVRELQAQRSAAAAGAQGPGGGGVSKPDAKVAAAAASAAKYYQRFLSSFLNPATGQLPDRVDPDNEPYFLMASFGLGRMMHKMRAPAAAGGGAGAGAAAGAEGGKAGPDQSYPALVMAAHKHLQWTTEYVKRHKLEDWTREAQAAEELSELLVEQMRLRAMAAASAARKGK